MKNHCKLSNEDIGAMSYNELIGLVRETNRTPGGNFSIYTVASRCFLTRDSKVLDIGTSTGSTAIEIARLVGCEVVGIDINESSLQEGRARAKAHGLQNVRFEHSDATDLPFDNEAFDLVFCGNVTSLITDKEKAFSEYQRVLRFGGYLAAIPMYYVKKPPEVLVAQVRDAIQVNIPVHFREDAIPFYTGEELEPFDVLDFRFDEISEAAVAKFCRDILNRRHLNELNTQAKSTLVEKYNRYMQIFRENLSYLGFTVVILRKTRFMEDPELFTARKV